MCSAEEEAPFSNPLHSSEATTGFSSAFFVPPLPCLSVGGMSSSWNVSCQLADRHQCFRLEAERE